MAITRKLYIVGIASAVALCIVLLPLPSDAQSNQTVVVKEKAIVSGTVVSPGMEVPAEGLVTPERPFSDRREFRPAGSAIVGQNVVAGEPGPDIINYASTVSSRTPNQLILNTVISHAEDDAVLSRLAEKVYMENGGRNYDNVTIFWHVGENPQPAAPWGRTDINKGSAVFKVTRLQ